MIIVIHLLLGGETRVYNVEDIITGQYWHYFHWGGRIIVHSIGQIFLLVGKPFFNVCNAIAYVLLVMVLYFHAAGKVVYKPLLLCMLNLFLFLFTPGFGDDFLWLIGSVNYLWGPLIALSFLLLYRIQMGKDTSLIHNFILSLLIGIYGVIAGWTNENMAVTLVVLVGVFNYFYWKQRHALPVWMLAGWIGVVVGAALLILAPGNFERLHVGNDTVFEVHFFANLLNITRLMFKDNYLLIPLAAASILLIITAKSKEMNWQIPFIYGLGLLSVNYSMAASPYFPERAQIGGLLFCLILCGYLYTLLDFKDTKIKNIVAVLAIVAISSTISQYNIARKDILSYKERDDKNITYILREKEKGNLDIVIPLNRAFTHYSAAWRGGKISEDKDFWVNKTFSAYYGIHSIRTDYALIKTPAGI